jgi:LPXTG-site transpeptidase (sortase) family protein
MKMIKKVSHIAFSHPLETVGLLLISSFLMVSLLDATGVFVPETSVSIEKRDTQRQEQIEEASLVRDIVPLRVVIGDVDVDTEIRNPNTTDIAVLDNELQYGAVHYPGSGTPGNGNMFLFGHSSSLSVIRNQAYKAFNGIQHLEKGDDIVVYSENEKHTYKVLNVELVSADEALVDFSSNKNMLTLSTCNNFGEKQERFVVEADYVRSESI